MDEAFIEAFPGNCYVLMRPNDIYKFKALSPKDYYLLPGEGAIKLVGS